MKNLLSKLVGSSAFIGGVSLCAPAAAATNHTMNVGNSALGASYSNTTDATWSAQNTTAAVYGRLGASSQARFDLTVNLKGTTYSPLYAYTETQSAYGLDRLPAVMKHSTMAYAHVVISSVSYQAPPVLTGNGVVGERWNATITKSVDRSIAKATYSFTVGAIPVTIGAEVKGVAGATATAFARSTPGAQTLRLDIGTGGSTTPSVSVKTHLYGVVGFDKVAGFGVAADLTLAKVANIVKVQNSILVNHGSTQATYYRDWDSAAYNASGLGGSLYAVAKLAGVSTKVYNIGSWSGYNYANAYAWNWPSGNVGGFNCTFLPPE